MNKPNDISIEGVIEEVKSFPIRDILRYYGCTDNHDTENMGCSHHTSENHTSLWVRDDNTCQCVSPGCGLEGDVIAAIAIFENWDLSKDFIGRILPKAYEIVGRSMPNLSFSKEDQERLGKANTIKKAHKVFYEYSKKFLIGEVKDYIKKKRDITDEDIDSLDLGYFPKERYNELKELLTREVPDIDNISFEDKSGKKKFLLTSYFAMSNRIIHPHIYKGDVVYITGEVTPFTDDKEIKYKKLNSNFSVSGNAEGYILDSLDSKDKSHIIVSEGYWDALALKLLGFNTITFGTCKISNYFICRYSPLLSKFNKIITCFDVEDNESGLDGALAFNNKLIEKSIFNTFISKLNKDGSKVDIEGLLHGFETKEEKKQIIKTSIIDNNQPYTDYFLDEISSTNDEEKLKEFLVNLEDCGNILYGKKIKKDITGRLGLSPTEIKQIIRDKQREDKETDSDDDDYSNFSDYKLDESDFGYLLTNDCIDKQGNPYTVEKADFDSIKNQNQYIYNILNDKYKVKNRFIFYMKKEEHSIDTSIEIKDVLREAKRDGVKVVRRDEEALSHFVNKFQPEDVKLTNCYGFVEGKHIDYPDYDLYNVVRKRVGGEFKVDQERATPSDSYKDFIKLEPNKKVVTKLIDMLNNSYPRSKEEKIYHKLIFSWSISSVLKMVLKHNGVKLHPILIVLGDKRKGKSTAMEMFITNLWCSELLQPDHFEGAKGARLKQIDNTLFPVYCDELMSLDRYSNELKNSTTKGFLKIPRGTKDGGFMDIVKYFNLAISANKYTVNDTALGNRMIIFNYDDYQKSILLETQVSWMLDNMKHLGRYIYDKLREYDFKTLISELDTKLRKEGVTDSRERFKLIYVRLGEKILESMGLYNDVEIPKDFVLGAEESISLSMSDTIQDILLRILSNLPLRFNEGKRNINLSIRRVLKDPEMFFNEDIFDELATKGIYFTKGFTHILINAKILPHINAELERKGLTFSRYKKLSTLADDLNIEDKISPLRIENPESDTTSARGFQLFTKEFFIDTIEHNPEKSEEEGKKIFNIPEEE